MQMAFSGGSIYNRLRVLLIASVVVWFMGALGFLYPIEIMVWTAQSKIGSREASTEIVFVDVPISTTESEQGMAVLAQAVDHLNKQKFTDLYLDLARDGRSSVKHSAELSSVLRNTENVTIVGRFAERRGQRVLIFPQWAKANRDQMVIADNHGDFLGFVWRVPRAIVHNNHVYEGFGTKLSGATAQQDNIEIDYRFSIEDITTINLDELIEGGSVHSFDHNTKFVFGYSDLSTGRAVDIPGERTVPESFIPIYAAQTDLAGGLTKIGGDQYGFIPLLAFINLLLLLSLLFGRSIRLSVYTIATASVVGSIVAPIFVPFRTDFAPSFALLLLYAGIWGFYRWTNRASLVAPGTGLPSTQLLQQDLAELEKSQKMVVVAARIHDFGESAARLNDKSKIEYYSAITKRLKATDNDLTIYSNGSDLLFWLLKFDSAEGIRGHLQALLAIFKNPVLIDGEKLDVAITFGADFDFKGEVFHRIGFAEALTDKTSLAAEPILFGHEPDRENEAFRVSLQSRIDNALETGQIYPVFQPQFELSSGRLVGYEALVRWEDDEKGMISPAFFIEQCERAGRMEKLQLFMLRSCMQQFKASSAFASNAHLSINVSATLLSNFWLCHAVEVALSGQKFPAERLILEITETAKIHDRAVAMQVVDQISSLGVKISLDDFGTGLAGLETFLSFPFSELKIDRSFSMAALESEKARSIIKYAVRLGNEVGVKVIAEGIEDEEACLMLRSLGCEYGQGFYLGLPDRQIGWQDNRQEQRLTAP